MSEQFSGGELPKDRDSKQTKRAVCFCEARGEMKMNELDRVWCLYLVVKDDNYQHMGPFFNTREKADKALLEREEELKRRNLTYIWKEDSNGKYLQVYDDGIISYTSVMEIPVK